MTTLLPADTFIVTNKTTINYNCDILTMLYQPIMGGISLSLYYSLCSLLDKKEVVSKEYIHHHLMNTLKLKLSDILEARERLEAVGLIKSFVKESEVNSYVYEIYSPISSSEFLNNPILNVILFNIIGKDEYERIVDYFNVSNINLDGYKNLSKKFSEVYEVLPYKSFEFSNVSAKKYNTNKIDVGNFIDFSILISSFPNNINKENVFSKTNKELINNLAFVYDLDILGLEKIIRSSITGDGNLDVDKLRKTARSYYTFENNGSLPNIVYKNQPESLKSNYLDKSNFSKMVYIFENTSPYDYLKSKQNGANPTKRDLQLLEELMIDYGLNAGVVNVLVDYVLKTSDNKLVKAYVGTIAGAWKRYNVKTVIQAIEIAKKEHNKYNKSTKVYSNKVNNTPDWFNEKIVKSEIDDKEIENLLEEFR